MMLYHRHIAKLDDAHSSVGSLKDCPFAKSPEGFVVAALVCVNTAELLPFQGPAACVVGAVVEAVKGPSLPDASATILLESNV